MQADGVVGVAEYEHLGLLGLDYAAKAVEVHTVALVGRYEGIFDHPAPVALDNRAEGRVDRRLYDNGIPTVREIVDGQGNAFDHTGDETQLVARDGKTMAAQLPVDNRLPIAVACLGIA